MPTRPQPQSDAQDDDSDTESFSSASALDNVLMQNLIDTVNTQSGPEINAQLTTQENDAAQEINQGNDAVQEITQENYLSVAQRASQENHVEVA